MVGAERRTGAVGGGAERPAERLLVDVAHVRQALADAVQEPCQRAEPGSGAKARLQLTGSWPTRPAKRSSDRIVPSLLTSGVKEWPAPDMRTGAGALRTRSVSSSRSARCGDQLRLGGDMAGPVAPFALVRHRRCPFSRRLRGGGTRR